MHIVSTLFFQIPIPSFLGHFMKGLFQDIILLYWCEDKSHVLKLITGTMREKHQISIIAFETMYTYPRKNGNTGTTLKHLTTLDREFSFYIKQE